MEACGLTYFGDDVPVSYDRFRDRIMFPIPDSRGRIIAFGGRALTSDALAKYLNSPETELFHKGNVLYNFARARKAMQKDGTVIAVEGYMDVIALAQAGFENVVAPLGTALTENQLELLWRMSGEPVLCFDGDQAGLKAAWRAADMVLPLIQAGPHGALRAAAGRQGPGRSGQGRRAGGVPRRACRGAAAGRSAVDARDLGRRVRHAGAAGRTGKDAARACLAHPRRERALPLPAGNARARACLLRRAARPALRQAADGPASATMRQGQGGQWARGGAAAGRLAVSESLARSAMVKRAGSVMPLREAAIVVALVNHPALVDENFDQVESLDLGHSDLRGAAFGADRCACAWRGRRPRRDGRGDRARRASAKPGSGRSG